MYMVLCRSAALSISNVVGILGRMLPGNQDIETGLNRPLQYAP